MPLKTNKVQILKCKSDSRQEKSPVSKIKHHSQLKPESDEEESQPTKVMEKSKKISKVQKANYKRNSASKNYKGILIRGFARHLLNLDINSKSQMAEKFREVIQLHRHSTILRYVREYLHGKTTLKTKNNKRSDKAKISSSKEIKVFIHGDKNDSKELLDIKRNIRELLNCFLTKENITSWLQGEDDCQCNLDVKLFITKNLPEIKKVFLNANPPKRAVFFPVLEEDKKMFKTLLECPSPRSVTISTNVPNSPTIPYKENILPPQDNNCLSDTDSTMIISPTRRITRSLTMNSRNEDEEVPTALDCIDYQQKQDLNLLD